MFGEHHDLAHELPEFKQAMHELKVSNAHFAKLFDAYHAADKEVRRMEEEIEPVADHVLEDAKKSRLALKDELFAMLKAHTGETA